MSMFGDVDDRAYQSLVAENEFINGLQVEIERVMRERSVSQVGLARSLGVSEARVSQILAGNGKNVQARTIAKLAFALGLIAHIEFRTETDMRAPMSANKAKEGAQVWLHEVNQHGLRARRSEVLNDNFWGDSRGHDSEELVAA